MMSPLSPTASSTIFTPLAITGVVAINFPAHQDNRGAFQRLWCDAAYTDATGERPPPWCQASIATTTSKYTLRGIHYQTPPYEEAKLVHCVAGQIYDVIVDLRPASPTYRQWLGVTLGSDSDYQQILIPKGCGHGYLTLADDVVIMYHMDTPYHPEAAAGFRWNDPAFAINWPASPQVIADKDAQYPDWQNV